MATFLSFGSSIGYLQGAPVVGNPILVRAKSMTISRQSSDTLSFHRLCLVVYARLSTSSDFSSYPMSTPVGDGESVDIDISSALRAVADSYVYTPSPTTYPCIIFHVKAYDEYMLNGEVKTNQGTAYLPSSSTYYGALMGRFTDMERLKAGPIKRVYDFCRKPTSSPQVVCVGETFAYTNTLNMPQGHVRGYDFQDIIDYVSNTQYRSLPESVAVDIVNEGWQQIGDVQVIALPAEQNRYQFRFINGLGVLDSISVYSLRSTDINVTQSQHVISTGESFSSFTRGLVRKSRDFETWRLSSGPLDRAWQSWFIHEFLMAEHVWVLIDSEWVRCHILTEETVSGYDQTANNELQVQFSVRLDIDGPVDPSIMV